MKCALCGEKVETFGAATATPYHRECLWAAHWNPTVRDFRESVLVEKRRSLTFMGR